MRWQRAGSSPLARRGSTPGRSAKPLSPVTSTSNAGSASSASASASRSANVRRDRRAGRHRADLAAAHDQAARVERLAQRQGDPPVSVPAQLDHLALRREQFQGPGEAGLGGAGVHDEVALALGPLGQREADAERLGDVRAGRVGVDELDAGAGQPGQDARDAAAHHPGADHGDPVADQRRRVPQGVHGGLDRPGEHRPGRGTFSGTGVTAWAGTTYRVWCG